MYAKFKAYVEAPVKIKYKDICEQTGISASKRVMDFIKQDFLYLKIEAKNHSNNIQILKGLPKPRKRPMDFFNITVDPDLMREYKEVCQEVGTTPHERINLFMEKDLQKMKSIFSDLSLVPVE